MSETKAKGVGRKRDLVRQRMLLGIEAALPDIVRIARGDLDVEVVDRSGQASTRKPTAAERLKAFAVLTKHALPTKTEVTGEDGGPLRVAAPDLSHLSEEQLRTLAGWMAGAAGEG